VSARPELLAQVRAHCALPPQAVHFDEAGDALFDVFSARSIPARAAEWVLAEARRDKQTNAPYLALRYGDGHELALSAAGIAFAPGFGNTGPLTELPAAVCMRDFASLLERLRHELYGHPDVAPTEGTLRLLLGCIAILDGARAVGFDVGREEPEVEVHLAELEKRAPKR
jgi:hypothetical protein